jgi:SEC-C motif-containing protein
MTSCPCGSGAPLAGCCGRFLEGGEHAPTAEALMRSRYTAFTLARIDYVTATHDPETREDNDPEAAKKWAENSEWLGLQIVSTVKGGSDDDEGTVEFEARYRSNGVEHDHREISTFVKREGIWYFSDGRVLGPRTVRHDGPRIGRNDPCPCGSGKKYKKCCGRG